MIVSKRSKGVAALLCFFFGGFGVHRIYAGKYGSAIVQLGMVIAGWGALLGGTSIGGVILIGLGAWVLVDFVMTLAGRFRDGDGAYIESSHAAAVSMHRESQRRSDSTESSEDDEPFTDTPARIQQRILIAAKQEGGVVSPATVAMHTGIDIDRAKDRLESLVDKGHAELQPTKDGRIVYVFRDMLTNEKRDELELL